MVILRIFSFLLLPSLALSQWASVGTLGSAKDKTSGTSIVLTTSAAAEVGNVAVITVDKDNAGTSDGNTSEFTTVTDNSTGGPNTWVKAREYCNCSAGANAGVVTAVFYSKIAFEIASGGTITVNFSDARTASAISAWEFTIGAGNVITQPETGVDGDYAGGTDFGSLDITTANEERLWVRADAWEGNNDDVGVYTKTLVYTSALTKDGTTGGGAASNMTIMGGEFDIFTGTTNASDPLFSTTVSDHASVLVALKQAAAPAAATRRKVIIH